ncbi:MAG: hypothetical protein LBL05_00450 [Synergistaceae bacterium]|jgi:hypothetical protein|nr:hypothetical protein [Synergistaceae bacterium]
MNELPENGERKEIPLRLICNEAKKSASRTVMLYICLSGAMFGLAVYYLFTIESPLVTRLEKFPVFFIFCLFLAIQLFSVKFYYVEEHKTCVRLLTVLLLLWFGFNVVFYFSPKLIPLVAVLLYPCFQILFARFFDFLGIRLRPIQSEAGRSFNRTSLLRKLRYYYSDNEMMYLVFLGFVSLLSLFIIISAYWSAGILTLFFIINIKTIAKYNPRKGFLYKKFLEGHPKMKFNPIAFNFADDILRPLKLFQCIGSGGFIYVFIYSYKWIKLPLSLQLSTWGACCWNLIMSEIYIYAVNVLEEIKAGEETV